MSGNTILLSFAAVILAIVWEAGSHYYSLDNFYNTFRTTIISDDVSVNNEEHNDGGNSDNHPMCHVWAQQGLCIDESNSDDDDELADKDHVPPKQNGKDISELCKASCLVVTLMNNALSNPVFRGKDYLSLRPDFEDEEDDFICRDDELDEISCAMRGEKGECLSNPAFMRKHCKLTCLICIPDDELMFDIGIKQNVPPLDNATFALDTLRIIAQSAAYMRDQVMVLPKFESVRKDCRNFHPSCSMWAARGMCEQDPVQMQLQCSPSCQTCHMLNLRLRCPLDAEANDVWKSSEDLDRTFQRILETETNGPIIISRSETYSSVSNRQHGRNEVRESIVGPWIVGLDKFLSKTECQNLIKIANNLSFKKSTAISYNADGTHEQDIMSEWRTSKTTWCDNECITKHSEVHSIMKKIVDLTGIPTENAEAIQFLKYEPGEFYVKHHDYIDYQEYLPCGPRILTFLLYLNGGDNGKDDDDREEYLEDGGDTFFPLQDIHIKPKKGSALVWANVLGSDPSKIDERVYHEALPVQRGIKYAANVWFHLREYQSADEVNCT